MRLRFTSAAYILSTRKARLYPISKQYEPWSVKGAMPSDLGPYVDHLHVIEFKTEEI